jgi:endonuclease/exonuclease/phosphatase family metal-dependent hydrolase
MGVHLTTLLGERDSRGRGLRARLEEVQRAQDIRVAQARQLLNLIRGHLLERGELVFLLGDFNAENTEPCMAVLENEGGFARLAPSGGAHQTHPKAPDAVDHILVYPPSRLVDYQCWTVNTDLARSASDHLPVVADVVVK